MRGYKYNGAIDRLDVQEGVLYYINDGQGVMFTHDIFNEIPEHFYAADVVFVDPPWNTGNLKSFYLKADKEFTAGDFENFVKRILEVLGALHDGGKGKLQTCFMEMGRQYADLFEQELGKLFGNVRRYQSKYYNKYPTFILQAWADRHYIDIPDEGKDELKVIDDIARLCAEQDKVLLDFFNGRGAVSRSAYKYGGKFICSEFNINRFAVAMEDLIKKGAVVTPVGEVIYRGV